MSRFKHRKQKCLFEKELYLDAIRRGGEEIGGRKRHIQHLSMPVLHNFVIPVPEAGKSLL